MALSIYILAGFMRHDNRSNEAAIKYLLLGAFSSGIMLYGMSLLYGITGTTNLAEILAFLRTADLNNPVIYLAMIMLVVSFGFKVAAVPFHMWVPDVYEGAPDAGHGLHVRGPRSPVSPCCFGSSCTRWNPCTSIPRPSCPAWPC